MITRKITLTLLGAVLSLATFAQESHGGQPTSFSKTTELTKNIPVVEMPLVNVQALMLEDSLTAGELKPYRFGFNHNVNLNPQNSGEWKTLKKGDKVWRLGIKCPEALSINLTFDKYIIPQGADLFIYTANHSYVLGSFTSQNVQADGQLGVDLLPGEEIVVEYHEPANAAFKGQLNIARVTHGYRDMFKFAKNFGDAGNCHNNVVCPVGVPWAAQTRSVAIIIVGGSGACTGALVNNTANNGIPYFLSAYHCGTTGTSTWVYRFNYNSPTCTPSANGPTTQSVSGATLKASASASDFTLVQLNSTPPSNYNVYYSGWNRSNTPPTSGSGIHHPAGDVKKISFITQGFDSTQWSGNGVKNHWFVQWSNGVTEGGSSGSPLFDQNKRVVGQLHGGASYCGAPTGSLNDMYGKFFYSWDKYGSGTSTQLKTWLDPQSTGVVTLDGYDPNQVGLPTLDAIATALVLPGNNNACITSYTPGLTVNNGGQTTITSLTITWSLDGGATQTYNWTGSLASQQTTTINLPQITFATGAHTYVAAITAVNGGADNNLVNNSQSGNFTSTQGITFQVTGLTDNYGNETSMYIISLQNDTVWGVDTGSIAANTAFSYAVCLADGCYKFVINDAYGDGMCCTYGTGNYQLANDQDVVIAAGGQFTTSASTFFCTTTPNNNAALLNITAPKGEYCKNEATPQVLLANQGLNPLTSVTIKYKTDNGALQSYAWTGNLAYNDSVIVSLPLLTLQTGIHIFTVFTMQPNGSADELMANDTVKSQYILTIGTQVNFTLLTDSFPNEIGWKITPNPGNTVLYQSAGGYAGVTAYTIPWCLPNGCYRFIITDTQGDGICCGYGNGSYTIAIQNSTQIALGGSYADADTVDFCIPLVGVTENKAPTFKVFPNPFTDNVFIAFTDFVGPAGYTAQVVNMLGQVVDSQSIANTQTATVNLAKLAQGMYILKLINSDNMNVANQIIIKR